MARRSRRLDAVAILGLGRFGTSLALELMQEEVEVLAVDSDQRIVESLAGRLTQVVSADTTSEDALRQLSVHEFYRVVIAVGNNLEASILTATVCLGSRPQRSGPKPSANRTPKSSANSACTTSCDPSTTWASVSPTSSPDE